MGTETGPHLDFILSHSFLAEDSKTFLLAHLAPMFTYFEGGVRADERDILVKIFQKVLKQLSWPVFFLNLAAAKKICQVRIFVVIWENPSPV